jgi:group I intron endonuclease
MEKICCIYCIENIVNNKKYIGYTIDFYKRKREHINYLIRGNHCNIYLQRSFVNYGKENFIFYIIEQCKLDYKELQEKEKYYIEFYNSYGLSKGYNLTKGGDGSLGYKHTEETKKKCSDFRKGKSLSEETKQKLSKILTGRKMSDEFKRKLSERSKKQRHSEETKQKLRELHLGKKASEETKRKISIASTGRIFSEATRAKLRGTKSEQALINVRKANMNNIGRKFGKEFGNKISIAQRNLKKMKNCSSKYIGVTYHKQRQKWYFQIFKDKERFFVGPFSTDIEAALGYNEYAFDLFGWNARPNEISQQDIDQLWKDAEQLCQEQPIAS